MKIKHINNIFKLFRGFICDFYLYCKAVYSSKYQRQQLIRDMMLIGHSLEKGMFFKDKKQEWGQQKAVRLTRLIEKYYNCDYELCPEIISAVNILNAYKSDTFASKNSELQTKINRILSGYESLLEEGRAGIKKVSCPKQFDKNEIMRFFQTRSSVRDFSDIPLSEKEIDNALEIAYLTPSACNRQSSKVYAVRNKQLIKEFLSLQLGDQGWCESADTLFLITGNMSCFGGVNERHQVYIDGGMFAMNFVMGLHLVGIASCFKMFVRDPKVQGQVNLLFNIPQNEVPIVCVFAGHYKQEPVNDPVSYRIKKKVNIIN